MSRQTLNFNQISLKTKIAQAKSLLGEAADNLLPVTRDYINNLSENSLKWTN